MLREYGSNDNCKKANIILNYYVDGRYSLPVKPLF